jgi:trans-2,3-dihydro-3-hydroxyanthranilate isomerase
MRFDYMIVDVFTDTPFGGNQLAVLTDARGLTTEGMQAVTREFNFAETTFVLPPDDPAHAARVRIFTPGRELPFAGHPTVGTACALVMSGAQPAGEFVLEEGVGPVPVAARLDGDGYSAWLGLTHAPEQPDSVPSAGDIATMLSLGPDDVRDVFGSSMGVNFTFVQVESREAVDRSALDLGAWRRILAEAWGSQLYVFAGELEDGGEIYARMYGPGFGIAEDPATGAAAAALAAAAGLRSGSDLAFDIRQGIKMGRPSLIRASARVADGKIVEVGVEGGCAFVAEGKIEIPDHFLDRS